MRAPFQILAIPYSMQKDTLLFCVLHRADIDQWQFIAGGGEDKETPLEAAKREVFEESGVLVKDMLSLTSQCYIPVTAFPDRYMRNWPVGTYVLPEYCFAFVCTHEITLSHEHTEYCWLPYHEALNKLQWDSNKTALYELKCRLEHK